MKADHEGEMHKAAKTKMRVVPNLSPNQKRILMIMYFIRLSNNAGHFKE